MKKTIALVMAFGFSFGVFTQNLSNCNQFKTDAIENHTVNCDLKSQNEVTCINKVSKANQLNTEDLLGSTIAPTRNDIPGYVYTPNGSSVLVYSRDELSPEQIDNYNYIGDALVPEANRIAPSSKLYNCHSYAWYFQSTLNSYWMNDPTNYYTDGSYEVSTGEIGDIICYFDDCDGNLHSGIVIDTLEGTSNGVCGDADLKIVRSKWGQLGLYEHRGDQCPYTSTYSGDAVYVMYFKPRTIETITLSNPSTNITQFIDRDYLVPDDNTIFTNYALYHLNVINTKNYSFEITSAYALDVRLYRKYMQLVSANVTNTYENGVYKISFSVNIMHDSYYLRVAFDYNDDYGTIHTKIINQHSHSYDYSYVWQNYTKHYADCCCGVSRLEGHVVSSSIFGKGNQYALCLLCGGLASIGFIEPLSLNDLSVSLNGSFVLPNGVIVLEDDDFESYLNGTLIFNPSGSFVHA